MEKQILQNETEKARIEYLKDSAEKIEVFTYQKPFISEQITIKKDQVIFKTDQIIKLKEKKKELVSEMNAEIKELQTDQITLVHEVTTGREDVTDDVYLLADQEAGSMGYYSKDGELVYERPLLPNEKQLSIMTNVKAI